MEDSKTIVPPSSPNISASGNNENESENHRNSQQKSKNFMSPTISAASKFISPKKKILSEWKTKEFDNLGISNPNPNSNSNSRNSSSKIQPFSSPKNNVLISAENSKEEEEETFVPESSTVPPYDPLTNYLSPRPKFLRYNPNRKRKLFVSDVCQSSCSSDSSSIEENNEVVEEDDDDEEEEKNWGLKWVFLKGLIVFFAWLFLTISITSMNDCTELTEEPPKTIRSIQVEYYNFKNLTFRGVSLMMFDEKNESKNGDLGVVDDGYKVKEIELSGSRFEDELEESESEVSEEEANAKLLEYEMNHVDSENEVDQIEVYDEATHTTPWFPDDSVVWSLSDFVGAPQNEEFEVKMMKSEDGVLEDDSVSNEVESVVRDSSDVIEEEVNIEGNDIIDDVRLTQMEFTLLVALSVVICVGFAVMKCYGKWKRKFLGSGVSAKGKFLPVEVVEEDDQTHEKADVSRRNLPPQHPQSVGVGEVSASRIVPRVKQLGEVEYGDSEVRSGRVQQQANVFSVSDDRRAKKSKGSSSASSTTTTSESHSFSSNLEDGKEKVSAVRRSKRIQDRAATSP